MKTSPVIVSTGDVPRCAGHDTSPLVGGGHVTTLNGAYPAARGMTTSPDIISTGDVPRCAGHDASPFSAVVMIAHPLHHVTRDADKDRTPTVVSRAKLRVLLSACDDGEDVEQTNHPLILTNQGVVSMDGAQT